MYGYAEHIEISPEQILQKISQEQIFEFVLKQKFDFNERYKSPFRRDIRPNCRFEERPDGTILFVDFGERLRNPAKTHRSCFGMMIDAYPGITVSGVIRVLCGEFGLSVHSCDYNRTVIENSYGYNRNDSESEESEITKMAYRRKQFNRLDVQHWSQYLIRPEELIQDNVFATNRFTVKKPGKKLKVINVYKYCYVYDFIDRIKVYQPFSEKYRFVTNCDENNIGNIDNLPETGDKLFIQKAYNDHRVLRNLNFGLNVIWFQNEGCVPDIYILKNLTERFKLINIFFDNDEAGTLASIKLCDIFNSLREDSAKVVHLPSFISRKLTYKNVSDFIHKEGRQELIGMLKQINVL